MQDKPRPTRSKPVMARVAMSHWPLLVKIGVRSWKARSVPVGRRLAKWAVLARARWAIDGCAGVVGGGGNDFRSSLGSESESESEEGEAFLVDGSLCFSWDDIVV